MENARLGFLEIKVISVPKRIRAACVKKCPSAMTLFGHDIGIRGRRFGSPRDVLGVNFVRAAGLEDLPAERIFADEARAKKGERGARFGQINQDIVGSASGPLGLGANVAELLGFGIHINQLDLIDNPIAAREQAAASLCGQFFHIGSTEMGSISEGEEVRLWQAVFLLD